MSVNEKMTALADSVRHLRGTTEKLGIDQMCEEVGATKGDIDAAFFALSEKGVSVPDGAGSDDLAALIAEIEAGGGGGDPAVEDGIIDGTVTEYTNPRVKSITHYAFYGHESLTTVDFPVVTYIGNSAFYSCKNLTSANFPAVTQIENNAFNYCLKLVNISFPATTYIARSGFQSCSSLTSANFPAVTQIWSYAFYGCNSLTSVSFPALTTIGGSAFTSCFSLTTVNFPVVTSIGSFAFNACTNLTSANFPAVKRIESYAFIGCSTLSALVLGASAVCTLSNSNAFSKTPIASGTGYVYVPASLLASYQTATNWTYFSSQFLAKEDMGV